MLKKIFKYIWRTLLLAGVLGLLGLLLPRLITTLHAWNRIYQADEAPTERVAIIFGAGFGATGHQPPYCATGLRPEPDCISMAGWKNC